MNKKQKKVLIRILAAAVLLVAFHFLPEEEALVLGKLEIPWAAIRAAAYLIP